MARAVEVFRENAVKVAELGVEEAARQKALAERQSMMEEAATKLWYCCGRRCGWRFLSAG